MSVLSEIERISDGVQTQAELITQITEELARIANVEIQSQEGEN